MKTNSLLPTFLVLFVLLLSGCADQQDFSQYDNLSITPTAEASLLYVEAPETAINEAAGAVYYSADVNFDAFSEPFVADNVLSAVITYEVENTTSKEIQITTEFLNAAGNILDTEIFLIDPAPTAILRREVSYGGVSGRSLDILRNTSAIRMNSRNLGDNTSTSNLPEPKIVFRSSAQATIRLK